ncbi:hypothetical protein L873DRAFT_710113 [Choiromyces venosus 120613-1]|uniref:Uncharacterized protein n=1 Tax=Choiromyces venosus 120613-1 TaxID=1336337 RepID=A0A3N4JRW3_9PEZI|nr:hypothetical protein L873DRAFT_710113 [Choiromyces venosus 120613-1]
MPCYQTYISSASNLLMSGRDDDVAMSSEDVPGVKGKSGQLLAVFTIYFPAGRWPDVFPTPGTVPVSVLYSCWLHAWCTRTQGLGGYTVWQINCAYLCTKTKLYLQCSPTSSL